MTPTQTEAFAWLCRLGVRCSNMRAEDAEVRARDYAQALGDMPREVFCDASAEAAAREYDRFPSYSVIRKFLDKWRATNRSAIALPGEDDPTLDHRDRTFLRHWQRDRASSFAESGASGSMRDKMIVALDLMQRLVPRTFRYVCRTDTEAAGIAVHKGWDPDPHFHKKSADEIAQVEGIVATITEELSRPQPRRAPSGPQTIEEVGPYVEKLRATVLTREQLEASYVAQKVRTAPPKVEQWSPPWERG